ncbi:MAG: alpha/beta hydrolase [Clostridia bacterium]|nr:alpha/beta hydrolase [Clostridia bacterium]
MIFGKQVEKIYKNRLYTRYEQSDTAFYFSPSDFEGLKAEPYAFLGKRGNRLQGYFYSYPDPIPCRLVVFEHGMGSGHRSYMREIETLARQGYLVFSYDRTGCVESEGAYAGGFGQALCDLDDCLTAFKKDERYKNTVFSVIGHSWGGYSTMNIPALHPDIRHIVAISGFLSIKQMHRQLFGKNLLSFYRKQLYRVDLKEHPDYAPLDARSALKDTSANALIIHSRDDATVSAKLHFEVLRDAARENPNVTFLLTDKKGHNPTYTEDAVRYKQAYFSALAKRQKKKPPLSPEEKAKMVQEADWWRMTAQDPEIWDMIFTHLEK